MSAILTICFDMSDGLVLSVVFASFTIIVRSQSPRWHILTRADDNRDYRETNKKELAYVEGNVCVLRFDGPLMYTSVQKFTKIIHESIKKWEKRDANTLHTDEMGFRWRVRGLRAILVIDCSGFSYVDHLGLNTLMRIYRDLEADGVITRFASPKGIVFYKLKKWFCFETWSQFGAHGRAPLQVLCFRVCIRTENRLGLLRAVEGDCRCQITNYQIFSPTEACISNHWFLWKSPTRSYLRNSFLSRTHVREALCGSQNNSTTMWIASKIYLQNVHNLLTFLYLNLCLLISCYKVEEKKKRKQFLLFNVKFCFFFM